MPIAIDICAGLGGWTEGLLAAGWTVIGFDIQRHQYGDKKYPAQLVLQDILTLHGKQFKDVGLIVASPPCQEFSYIAMPWSRGKQIGKALRGAGAPGAKFPDGYEGSKTVTEMTALFDACFRIQREACEAAERHIPMVVENVKGAQPWVGKAKANYGSFYLWGDVQMVGNKITGATRPLRLDTPLLRAPKRGMKNARNRWSDGAGNLSAATSSKSPARKAASASIAKIPFALAEFIGKIYMSVR